MPTDIYFAGQNVRVEVDEDPGEVADAFASAHGLPFRLTAQDSRADVYINPGTVAFWSAAGSRSEREREPESVQPATQGQGVTDIWGKPIRRNPRR